MRQGFVNSSLGYPQVERGKSMPLPPYESLEDPHLNEYFERRFGSIQYVSRVSIYVTGETTKMSSDSCQLSPFS